MQLIGIRLLLPGLGWDAECPCAPSSAVLAVIDARTCLPGGAFPPFPPRPPAGSAGGGGGGSSAAEAIQAVADGVTQCKFEATYPASDECVLYKILDVLVACVACPSGTLLTNDNLINIFQACYRIGHFQTEKGRDTSGRAVRRGSDELVWNQTNARDLDICRSPAWPQSC